MRYLFALLMSLAFFGCTDAGWGKVTALGNAATIKCYSGGQLIFEGKSTGKVSSEQNSDGYYFKDAKTNRVMEVSGDCIIVYDP